MRVASLARGYRKVALVTLAVAASTCAFPITAHAGCWSVLKSPKWADMQASLATAKLCEVLPEGTNRTRELSISVFDICDAPGGVRLHAEASLECKTSDGALFQAEASASAKADVTVDIGSCSVTNSHVELGGTLGSALSGISELQYLVKQLAQSKLSELCGR